MLLEGIRSALAQKSEEVQLKFWSYDARANLGALGGVLRILGSGRGVDGM